VLRPIAIGEEITAHYGDGYCVWFHLTVVGSFLIDLFFRKQVGRKNRHCLCATCEKNGRGGYAPQPPDADLLSGSESESDLDSDTPNDSDDEAEGKEHVPLNVNERRTRRGVYHIAQDDSEGLDDSDAENKDKETKEEKKIAKQEEQDESDLSSLPFPSDTNSNELPARAGPSRGVGMMTPDTDTGASPSSQAHPSAANNADNTSRKSTSMTPYKSIIATRRQKAAAAEERISAAITKPVKVKNQLVTPPPSVETASLPDEPNAPASAIEKRVTRSISSAKLVDEGKSMPTSLKTKGKAKGADKTADEDETEEPEVTRVLRTRPSAHASLGITGSPVKPEIPRDERGRPLPTCITCFNILPIIHVDKEIVWGVGKKKEMPECPR
jgi:[histone H4]-N-methyl-L-lysine20 N-methyltransferase